MIYTLRCFILLDQLFIWRNKNTCKWKYRNGHNFSVLNTNWCACNLTRSLRRRCIAAPKSSIVIDSEIETNVVALEWIYFPVCCIHSIQLLWRSVATSCLTFPIPSLKLLYIEGKHVMHARKFGVFLFTCVTCFYFRDISISSDGERTVEVKLRRCVLTQIIEINVENKRPITKKSTD